LPLGVFALNADFRVNNLFRKSLEVSLYLSHLPGYDCGQDEKRLNRFAAARSPGDAGATGGD
jgi:hypothetical protein